MDKVIIRDTNSVFDGMSGTVESQDGDKVTVMIDFKAGHKVRNTFNKSCVSGLDEDITGVETDDDSDYKKGSKEFMDSIKKDFDAYEEVSNFEIKTPLYPERDWSFWYMDNNIYTFVYKNRMLISCWCFGGSDSYIYLSDDEDEDYVHSAYDLEERGIFTDDVLNDLTKDLSDPFREEYSNFEWYCTLLDKRGKPVERGLYSYDYNFDNVYSLSEATDDKDIIAMCKEWMEDIEKDFPKWAEEWNNTEEVNEDIEDDEDAEYDDADYLEAEDQCRIALSEYTGVDEGYITLDRKTDYNGYIFTISGDAEDGDYSGTSWAVYMNYDDAYNEAYSRYYDYLEYDADLADYFSIDTLIGYIDDDYWYDDMEEYYRDYVWNDMDDADIIDECESRDILDPSDKELATETYYKIVDAEGDTYEDGYDDFDEAEAAAEALNAERENTEQDEADYVAPFSVKEYEEVIDDEGVYPEDVLDRAKDALVDEYMSDWDSSKDWYIDTYGERQIADDIRNGYISFDISQLADDMFTDEEVPYQLAWYDNDEHTVDVDWLDGHTFYLYWRE